MFETQPKLTECGNTEKPLYAVSFRKGFLLDVYKLWRMSRVVGVKGENSGVYIEVHEHVRDPQTTP